ncbi:MAG: potassium transporter TrkA [Candidatus Wallbacteria bacterium HGW-Wallbacteria-1]|jgi:trk system potassium uptake protein TrkA|uniref:Potassium transporter TrkA n=1 Tax=Candidatus Wallbacteria bacterium HGW-Wallbacteria-1 TaxID=2013854 RepID=A0A2N1PM45_9BACT|nr:MAG: potassium transporter TrkA [Candidatus Wallbacteria bacterium HGW-Wallbacteria-1]
MRVTVIGLGQFGRKVATTLFSKGIEVMALDRDPKMIEAVKDHVTQAVNVDVTDLDALKALKIETCDVVIIAIGDNLEMSILATVTLKNLGVPMIISRATSDIQAQILYSVGARRVINIEAAMGENIANSLAANDILEHIQLATGHSLVEARVPAALVGKTLLELDVRRNFSINIVVIQRRVKVTLEDGTVEEKVVVDDLPGPDSILEETDTIFIVGQNERIQRFLEGKGLSA